MYSSCILYPNVITIGNGFLINYSRVFTLSKEVKTITCISKDVPDKSVGTGVHYGLCTYSADIPRTGYVIVGCSTSTTLTNYVKMYVQ